MPRARRRQLNWWERRLERFAASPPGGWFFVNVANPLDRFLLNDQEILIRHLHKETAAWIEDYRRTTTAGV